MYDGVAGPPGRRRFGGVLRSVVGHVAIAIWAAENVSDGSFTVSRDVLKLCQLDQEG